LSPAKATIGVVQRQKIKAKAAKERKNVEIFIFVSKTFVFEIKDRTGATVSLHAKAGLKFRKKLPELTENILSITNFKLRITNEGICFFNQKSSQ
jgi:hypothetical protein